MKKRKLKTALTALAKEEENPPEYRLVMWNVNNSVPTTLRLRINQGKQPLRVCQLAAHEKAFFVVEEDGSIYSWGDNSFGVLGHATLAECEEPKKLRIFGVVPSVKKPKKRPLDAPIEIKSNIMNQIQTILKKTPTTKQQSAPIQAQSVAIGSNHVLALTKDGAVFGWGQNYWSQLGLNQKITSPDHVHFSIQQITSLSPYKVVEIAAGHSHSLALTSLGEILAWGANEHGQLGLGKDAFGPISEPSVLPFFADGEKCVKSIAAGWYSSAAITADGKVFTWGASPKKLDADDVVEPQWMKELSGHKTLGVRISSNGRRVAWTEIGRVFSWGIESQDPIEGVGLKADEKVETAQVSPDLTLVVTNHRRAYLCQHAVQQAFHLRRLENLPSDNILLVAPQKDKVLLLLQEL